MSAAQSMADTFSRPLVRHRILSLELLDAAGIDMDAISFLFILYNFAVRPLTCPPLHAPGPLTN